MTQTESELRAKYQEYCDNFDPTPLSYGEDYLYMLDYDSWLDDNDY